MPKKSKRQSSQARQNRAVATVSSGEVAEEASSSSSRGVDRSFNPDYSYVIKDLRRIGVLAGTFFGILIVLSFIL